jgi:hypothetical protein
MWTHNPYLTNVVIDPPKGSGEKVVTFKVTDTTKTNQSVTPKEPSSAIAVLTPANSILRCTPSLTAPALAAHTAPTTLEGKPTIPHICAASSSVRLASLAFLLGLRSLLVLVASAIFFFFFFATKKKLQHQPTRSAQG